MSTNLRDLNHLLKITDTVTRAYIEAVYFTDTGDHEQPDANADMSTQCILRCVSDVAEFLQACGPELLAEYQKTGRSWDSFGHDFWLTRCRHGAGFWDRGMGDLGDRLTDKAHQFSEGVYIWADEADGLIYMEG